jgi:hypothetical protein
VRALDESEGGAVCVSPVSSDEAFNELFFVRNASKSAPTIRKRKPAVVEPEADELNWFEE